MKKDKPHNPIRIRFLKNITAYMPKKHRKKNPSNVCRIKKSAYLCNRKRETTQAKLKSLNVFQCEKRAFSSAGSEHLPYKQRVGGSNPSTPTTSYGSVAQLNRASDYGSEGYRFESCRSHQERVDTRVAKWGRL